VVTAEDGLREGGIGSTIAQELAERTAGAAEAPRVAVLGVPVAYIPHGKPDAILAELGLDAAGIAAAVLRHRPA
jgi:1-deoxy-D-xylulose-5-phosphate synthase